MNKLLSLLYIVTILSASELQWSNDYNQTLQKAQKEHKKVLLMYHASWCPECGYMKKVVFKDPKLQAYMQKNYALVAYDITKDKARLPKQFTFLGVPTFFFVSPEGKLITKFEGSADADKFLEKIKGINQ